MFDSSAMSQIRLIIKMSNAILKKTRYEKDTLTALTKTYEMRVFR